LRDKAVRGVKWTLIEQLGMQLSSFAVFLVLARLLDPEAFGLVAMASITVASFRLLLGQGLSAAIVQRAELEPEHLDTAFWINVLLGSSLVGLVVALSGLFAELYEEPEIESIVTWLAVSLLFTGLSTVQEAMLKRRLNFRALALRNLLGDPIGGVVGVGMALAGYGFWSLVAQQLVASVVRLLTLWLSSSWRPRARFSLRHLKELLGFGLSMMGSEILAFANKRLDQFLVGYFLGVTLLGYYNIAKRLIIIVTEVISGSINKVAWPVFSSVQKNPEKLKYVFFEATKFTSLIAFPAFLGLVAISPQLVPLLFGDKWIPAIPVLQVLAGLGMLRSVMRLQASLLVGIGYASLHLRLQLILAVASVIGFMLVKHWGLVAVAFSYVVVTIILMPMWLRAVHRLVGFDLRGYFSQYAVPLQGSLAMFVIAGAASAGLDAFLPLWSSVLAAVVVGAAVYVGVVYWRYPSLLKEVRGMLGSGRRTPKVQ
jgi:PST family polysaccharide transporter